jgi:hypothetical protein
LINSYRDKEIEIKCQVKERVMANRGGR